ncbi:MAG: nuclear transport factor 2 family protein [Gemmatimonadaceae bacterium]|nr:nuclear transport factor 2 family protein [Gemmatimonadaceae bacterium]
MHPNAETITRFYSSFQRHDAEGMIACYAPDVEFSDEVFTDLRGPQAGAMWRMLCTRSGDLEITVNDVTADGTTGHAHWDARYTFSTTGRRVHNSIDASFEFRDGRIVRHRDRFSFWRWSRQALGATGWLLGWTPMVRNKVRGQAAAMLAKFSASA